jgi:hypothetical protein
MFTYQQYTGALRWALNVAGVALMAHGYGNTEIWAGISGLVLSSSSFVWMMIRHTKIGTVLAADDLPEVAGVITKSTSDGIALAKATPKETVVTTGTPVAAAIAQSTSSANFGMTLNRSA